jgi:hypothetical protein
MITGGSLVSVKKVVGALVIIFVIYAIWTSPTQSGEVANNGWDQVQHGLGSVKDFFNTLLGG